MLTRYDKILLFALVLFVFLSLTILGYIARLSYSFKEVVIYYQNKEVKRFLKTDKKEQLKINGCLIEIENGRARVISSTCPDKICISYGWIEKPSQSIVCLPHRVLIKIEEKNIDQPKYDFINK